MCAALACSCNFLVVGSYTRRLTMARADGLSGWPGCRNRDKLSQRLRLHSYRHLAWHPSLTAFNLFHYPVAINARLLTIVDFSRREVGGIIAGGTNLLARLEGGDRLECPARAEAGQRTKRGHTEAALGALDATAQHAVKGERYL